MRVINLTPHNINLDAPNKERQTFAPSGTVARVSTLPQQPVEGFPFPVLSPVRYGAVEGLPEPQEGTFFLVSGFVAAHVKGRDDVFSPGTAPAHAPTRNEKGHIVAVRCFVQAG